MFRRPQLASLYRTFRPVYPLTLVQRILKFVRVHNPDTQYDSAVDVGCGSGQLTRLLSPFYNSVYGIDESPAQIEEAVRQNQVYNVAFGSGSAEKLDLENGSVDLVTAAQCIHWLDAGKFYQEVRRVLKPRATLAIVTYRNPILETMENDEISRKMTETSDDVFAFFRENNYMDARAVFSKYKGHELQVPFINSEKDSSIFMTQESTIDDFVGFISSTSHYANFARANPEKTDFLERIRQRLIQISGGSENVEITLKYPLDLTLACVD